MINPTLEFDRVADHTWDAVIIGAGPAGALAAHLLARAGHAVLLVDKSEFPRQKVCGSCLNPAALRILRDCGLGGALDSLRTAPVHVLHWAAGGRAVSIPLPEGAAVTRGALDTALIQAAIASGAAFLSRVDARVTCHAGEKSASAASREVALADLSDTGARRYIRARVILVADGLGGRALDDCREFAPRVARGSYIGMGTLLAEIPSEYGAGTIHMACGTGGYVGIVRVETGQWDVAAAVAPASLRAAGGAAQFIDRILSAAGLPAIPNLAQARWHGTPALTRSRRRSAFRVFCLGDAAGYGEPFVGDGISWALLGATAVAPLAARALASSAWNRAIEPAWERCYFRRIDTYRRTARLVATLLRLNFLTTATVAMAAALPSVAAPLARFVAGGPDRARRASQSPFEVEPPTAPAPPQISQKSSAPALRAPSPITTLSARRPLAQKDAPA